MRKHLGILIALAAVPLAADTLYLRDGRTLNGVFQGGTSREIRFNVDGGTAQRIAITQVRNLVVGNGQTASTSPAAPDATRSRTASATLPTATVVTVRTIDPITSDSSNVGTTYRATLEDALVVDGRTIAPKGTDASIKVVNVQQSGTLSGREEIALVLSEIRANGQTLVPNTSHATVSAKSRKNETAKIVGGTAVVGAIIGAIAGGGKGAAIGAATGAGAGVAIQAIKGQKIEIPSESTLDFTLSEPLSVY